MGVRPRETKPQDTRVDALPSRLQDAGSIPAASTKNPSALDCTVLRHAAFSRGFGPSGGRTVLHPAAPGRASDKCNLIAASPPGENELVDKLNLPAGQGVHEVPDRGKPRFWKMVSQHVLEAFWQGAGYLNQDDLDSTGGRRDARA